MDRVASRVFGIAVLISLIQNLHAITQDEYQEKSTAIKSKPEIKQFLKDNDFMLSQYGVFMDKVSDVFNHTRKTQVGSEMMKHVWDETEKVLKEKRTFGFIKSILEGARRVLASEVGRNNIFAVARFIQDELQIPKLFEMCISLKKIILYILLSENGLDALVKIKENNAVLERDERTSKLLDMMNNDFPILSLPTNIKESDGEADQATKTNQNVSEMKSIVARMDSITKQ